MGRCFLCVCCVLVRCVWVFAGGVCVKEIVLIAKGVVILALPWRVFSGRLACISPVSRLHLTVSLVSRVSLYRFCYI